MILSMQPASLRIATAELGECERLFLWCVRSWVHAAFQRRAAGPEIRAALGAHRLEATAADVEDLMGGLARFASGTIDIRIRRATELSGDEIRLIRALHAHMRDCGELADHLLRSLALPPGRAQAGDALKALAAGFRSAGLAACDWPGPGRAVPWRPPASRAAARRSPRNDIA